MLKIPFLLFSVLCSINLFNSSPNKRKRFVAELCGKRLGIPYASEALIRQYENEHKIMHRKEDGSRDEAEYTEWPQKLYYKNLTEYCKKYLKAIISRRNIRNTFGVAEEGRILYLHQIDSGGNISVGVIKCQVGVYAPIKRGKIYYITEAPEKECVYSLMHWTRWNSPFAIISKVCGFANDNVANSMYINNQPKDRVKLHGRTGIHIAPRDLIKQYEYRHQEMYKKDDGSIDIEKYKAWPLNQDKTYLTEFCTKYLQTVVPNRVKQKNLLGEGVLFELEYTQYNQMSLEIGIIKCHVLPSVKMKTVTYYYYITKSPEPDCVYTLLRQTQASICMIVGQICNMKIDCDTKEWVNIPHLNTPENVNLSNSPNDDIEDWEMKPDLKIINLFPRD